MKSAEGSPEMTEHGGRQRRKEREAMKLRRAWAGPRIWRACMVSSGPWAACRSTACVLISSISKASNSKLEWDIILKRCLKVPSGIYGIHFEIKT